MSILEERASTLSEVLTSVKRIRDLWNPGRKGNEEIWFRGQAKRSYGLQPGLYRPNVAMYKYDEYTLVTAFISLAAPFVSTPPASNWDWYFLAQHYRLPTRLLDWTESLLVAVYFAVAQHIEHIDKPTVDAMLSGPRGAAAYDHESPTVWMIDAGTVNLWSCNEDGLYAPPNKDIDGYLWSQIHDSGLAPAPHKPIAIHPPRQNSRIVAQQGMFTLHGREPTPIDEIAATLDPSGIVRVACIVLDKNGVAFIWDELRLAGVGRLGIFPEIDSVAEHVKWVYQGS